MKRSLKWRWSVPLLSLVLVLPADVRAQQPAWELASGANYTRYRDPLGTDHGPRTGRSAEGAGFCLGAARVLRRSGAFGEVVSLQGAWSTAGYAFDESSGSYGTKFLEDGLDRGRRSMQVLTADACALLTWHGLPGLRVEAGPMLRVVLGAWERRRGERLLQAEWRPLDERRWSRDLLAPLDLGVCFGALVEGPEGIGFALRSFTGITDLDRGPGASASYTAQLQFVVVYRL